MSGTKEARQAREARFEDFEFLVANGEDVESAALRAGWPTLGAAARALRRAGHPAASAAEAASRKRTAA